MLRKLALVRPPGPRLAEGLVTHIDRRSIDQDLAVRQWHAYVEALHDAGWDIIEVPGLDDCPDAVFIEDTVVVYGDTAVISRPGAESRRPETAHVEPVLAGLGYRVTHIEEPATLDGGDVLKHAGTVWVGVGGRTTPDAADQLAEHLEPYAAELIKVPVEKVLHLKSAVTALPDGTVIGYPPLVDDPSVFPKFLAVPEEPGAHVVLLGGKEVLLSAAAPQTKALLEDQGLVVRTVDISEFEKLEGCVTCLSVRLRAAPLH